MKKASQEGRLPKVSKFALSNHQKLQMKRLDKNQRYLIFKHMQAGECPAQIAKILDVNRSTVTREIERNSVDGKYLYEKAEMLAQGRQHEAHVHYRYGQQLWDEIGGMIRQGMSPEQVCGRLRKLGREAPSAECIYQYIWEMKSHGDDLYTFLRCKGKKHRSRGRKNDRAGGYVWIRKLNGKNAEELADATIKALRPLKKLGVLHTITSDNGKEFASHEKIAKKLKIDFYFARPYCSCDRGANENTNGLIRQYIPKGTDLDEISEDYVDDVQQKLNDRPRKRFDYMTPREYIFNKFNIMLR